MAGKLITIYGVNNMGKSTHARRLTERFEQSGQKAKYIKYPVYDLEPSGPFINKILRAGSQKISEQELQLWFVVNRHQAADQLEQWLEEGYVVVAEDYIGTGMAWGMAKGLSEAWVETVNQGLRNEDLAILITGERVKSAVESGHVHEENEALIQSCYLNLQHLADKYRWRRVELQPEVDDTAELIWKVASEH